MYSSRSLADLNEIVRIPLIEYLVVAVLALLTWLGLLTHRLIRKPARQGPSPHEVGP